MVVSATKLYPQMKLATGAPKESTPDALRRAWKATPHHRRVTCGSCSVTLTTTGGWRTTEMDAEDVEPVGSRATTVNE